MRDSYAPILKPAPRVKAPAKGLKRTEIGAKAKARIQWEAQQAAVLEGTKKRMGLFQLHRLDWVHFETVKTSRGTLKSGFPDYYLMGPTWDAYLEIKARNLETKKWSSRMSAAQHSFHAKLTAVGREVWTAYLPDDLQRVQDWLCAKTGVVVDIDGLVAA